MTLCILIQLQMASEFLYATSDTIQEEKTRKVLNGIPNVISLNAYHHMHKMNKSDEVNKKVNYARLFAIVPLMLNLLKSGSTFRGSSWVCCIPRAWCLRLQPEKKRHYQLCVLVLAEGMGELWCGCRIHTAQSHVRVPVHFASGFPCNTCSVVRGFLHITSL